MKVEPGCTVAYAGLETPRNGALAPGSALARFGDSVTGIFAACLGLAVLVRYNGLFPSVIDWDVSLYSVMAQHWLQGGLPYETVWDQHPVGLPALLAAILYVFPQSTVAVRLTACVAVAVTATTIYFAARRLDRSYVSPITAVVLYVAWTARLWGLAGNTELYLSALVAPAIYIAMRENDAARRGALSIARLCLAALLLGLAVQVKHVAVAESALFFGVVLAVTLRNARQQVAYALTTTTACFLLPSVLVTAYFCFQGLAAQYFYALVEANLLYLTDRPGLGEILPYVPRSFLLPLGAILAAMVLLWRSPNGHKLVLLWSVAAVIDVILPGKFWPHYFLLMMPPAALLAGHVAAIANEALNRRWRRASAVVFPMLVLLAGNPVGVYADSAKMRALAQRDVPRIIADNIGQDLAPDDSIFVYNYQPILYLLTDAELPTRHVLPADWSQRFSGIAGVDPMRELEHVFRSRPKYVVFLDTDWLQIGGDVLDSLHDHLSAYEKHFEISDVQILPEPVMVQVYRRKPTAEVSGR